jgi:hypothetical protein
MEGVEEPNNVKGKVLVLRTSRLTKQGGWIADLLTDLGVHFFRQYGFTMRRRDPFDRDGARLRSRSESLSSRYRDLLVSSC